MRHSAFETLVGFVVVAIAAVFLFFAYSRTGGGAGGGAYELIAKFDQVGGLAMGSDVRLGGIKIGRVTGQELDPATYQAVVTLAVNRGVELPEDSSAKVTSDGLLGDTYLAIQPGGALDMLAAGDEIEFTQGAVDLIGLVGKALYGTADDEAAE